jgi:hypothetical protein
VAEGLVLEVRLRVEAAEVDPGGVEVEVEAEAVGLLLTDGVQVPRAEERRRRGL